MTALNQPLPGSQLEDIILQVRRFVKTQSSQALSDTTIGDYINKFVVYDAMARNQLFELRRQYTFETIANIFEYQIPFVTVTDEDGNVTPTGIPQYQMIKPPVYCDGVQIGYFQSNEQFYNIYPELVLNEQPITGNGSRGPYTILYGRTPFLRAYIDDLNNLQPYVYITATDANGNQHYIVDSGWLTPTGLGILVETDPTFQNIIGPPLTPPEEPFTGGGSGTVDYINGIATFTFIDLIPDGGMIYTQTSPYSAGVPRILNFFNNTIKMYPVPDRAYKIQVDAFVTPAQFINTNSFVPFAYMSEWFALGAARKILRDVGDSEQIQFLEPFFREQECLVLRRSNRQQTVMRTPTIFSTQTSGGQPWSYTQY